MTPNRVGMQVTEVKPGSVADELGLEPGDIIVTIHGWPVRSLDWWDLLLCGDGAYVRLEIRDGQTGERVVRYAPLE